MKKRICIIISVAMMLAMCMTGCGQDETAAVKETVNGFLTSMLEGKYKEAKTYCDDEFGSLEIISVYDRFDKLTETLADSLGINEDDLSNEARASVDNFKKNFLTRLIGSYKINKVSISENGTAKADVTITYVLDIDRLSKMDFANMSGPQKMATAYMTKHQDEFVKIYQEKGEKAAKAKLINDLLPDLMSYLDDKISLEAKGSTEENAIISLEKNDDGKWLIITMKAGE